MDAGTCDFRVGPCNFHGGTLNINGGFGRLLQTWAHIANGRESPYARLVKPRSAPSLCLCALRYTRRVLPTASNGHYEWHFSDVERLQHPRKPRRQPQPVWFKPFKGYTALMNEPLIIPPRAIKIAARLMVLFLLIAAAVIFGESNK